MRAQMNAGKIVEVEKVPMLHRLLQYQYPSTNSMMPDHDIISEAMGHMLVQYPDSLRPLTQYDMTWHLRHCFRIAGSDTGSTSLSYFFWELSRRGDIMKKLQQELDEVMPDSQTIPDVLVLQRLPYLNAFIKEGT
jgi:Cytochrome P450